MLSLIAGKGGPCYFRSSSAVPSLASSSVCLHPFPYPCFRFMCIFCNHCVVLSLHFWCGWLLWPPHLLYWVFSHDNHAGPRKGLISLPLLQPAAVRNTPLFLQYLTRQLHQQVPGGLVLWYDSVVQSGQLKWQDELNEQNR